MKKPKIAKSRIRNGMVKVQFHLSKTDFLKAWRKAPPEFGDKWEAPTFRRMVRIGLSARD